MLLVKHLTLLVSAKQPTYMYGLRIIDNKEVAITTIQD